jgi:putative ABC transport system permease protein
MTARLAAASVRHRLGSFAGTFLTAVLAIALLAGGGLLLFSVLTAGPGADRFATADATVAGDRVVALTTRTGHGHKVKVKTKQERLTGAEPLSRRVVETVARTPGVAHAVPDYAFLVALYAGGKPLRVPEATTVAHGWSSAALTPYPLREGRAPRRGEVVLQHAFGARVGQTVRLTSRTGTRALRVAGVVGGNVPGQAAVFVADSQVSALSGLPGPTAVAVHATPHGVAALRARLTGTATVHTGAGKEAADLPGAVPDYIAAISIFGFVLGLTGFAAVFVLTGTVSLALRQRMRELALLRTAGATPRQLGRMLRLEAVLVALAAALPGLPGGVAVAEFVAARFREVGAVPPQFTVSVDAAVLAAAAAAGVLVTVVSTGLAARRAVRIAPTQALRESMTGDRARLLPRLVVAAVLVAGAVAILTFVPLGGPFGMGMGFISCSLLLCATAALGPFLVRALTAALSRAAALTGVLGRLAGALTRAGDRRVAGVAIPLTLMFAINATMLFDGDILAAVTSDEQAARTAPATVRVSSTNAAGMPLVTAERVGAERGVSGSAATLGTRVVVDEGGKPEDHPAQGLRTTGTTALDLGVTAGDLGRLGAGQVAVSGPLARARGWRVGDRPTLWLADGTRVRLTVIGVYANWRGFGDLVLPAELVAAHDPRGLVDAVYLRGMPDLATAVADRWPTLATARAGDPGAAGGGEPNNQAAWELMVAISLGFTAIAVANTFAVATAARRREFASLRLAGATARQLHRLLGREALLTVAVALVLGCVVSGAVVSTFSVAQDGQWRLFADPVRYLAMLGGVGLLGVVAGAVPARVVIGRRSLPQLTG